MRAVLIASVSLLTLASSARACPAGLDGTFIQLRDEQLRWGEPEWMQALTGLRELGISTIVVQYTGDADGFFESRYAGARPLERMLIVAGRLRMKVWLGLDHAPDWPDIAPPTFAPLENPRRVAALARLCSRRASCVGFYLSPEIDDATWAGRARALRVRLQRASRTLRARMPRARISIAPFFTRRSSPEEHARFLVRLLAGTGVDVVMLQGGTGTGRASACDVRSYFRALAPLREHGIEPWLVVELFEQLAGTPWDERPFAARPTSIEVARRALLPGERQLEHRIAFSVLDYMTGTDPRARRLRADYRAFCERQIRGIAERAATR